MFNVCPTGQLFCHLFTVLTKKVGKLFEMRFSFYMNKVFIKTGCYRTYHAAIR